MQRTQNAPGRTFHVGGHWQLSGGVGGWGERTERAGGGVSEPQVQRQKRLMLQRTWRHSELRDSAISRVCIPPRNCGKNPILQEKTRSGNT